MWLWDGFRNFVSAIGTSKDKATSNGYCYLRLDQQTIDALYLEDWLARKIVDIVPADEVREWRVWEGRQAEQMYAAEASLQVRAHVRQALTWARLYGGAAILIGDGSADPAKPLNIGAIERGGIKYLHTFNRWELSTTEFDRDILSPTFGKPKGFRIAAANADNQIEVHRSRLVIFEGIDAPRLIRQTNDGWGMPVFQAVRQAIMNVASGTMNAAALIEEAKIDIIKIPDLINYLADAESSRRLTDRFALAMQLKSNVNTLILGGDEEFERKQVSFDGLPDLLRTHIDIAAGAADIPVTRLLGQSPKGMNATGEHDLRNYYDMVRAKQTTELSDTLQPLDEALKRHALGKSPRNLTYAWAPLWQPTAEQAAAIAKTKADTTTVYVAAGIFPPAGFAKAVRDQIVQDGVYPSFDEHVLPDDLDSLGNVPPGPAPKPTGGDANDLERPAALIDATPKSLYVSRKVLNAGKIIEWASRQGLKSTVPAEEMHVTIAYSRDAVDWFKAWDAPAKLNIPPGGARDVERFDGGAVVLLFASGELRWRWQEFRDLGASWDHDDFSPHVTISYDAGGIDLSKVEPYAGPIRLGPEIFATVDEKAT